MARTLKALKSIFVQGVGHCGEGTIFPASEDVAQKLVVAQMAIDCADSEPEPFGDETNLDVEALDGPVLETDPAIKKDKPKGKKS